MPEPGVVEEVSAVPVIRVGLSEAVARVVWVNVDIERPAMLVEVVGAEMRQIGRLESAVFGLDWKMPLGPLD